MNTATFPLSSEELFAVSVAFIILLMLILAVVTSKEL